jgi:hypothetical protein
MTKQKPSEDQQTLRLKLEAVEATIAPVEQGICRLWNKVIANVVTQETADPGQLAVVIKEAIKLLTEEIQERSLIGHDVDQIRRELGGTWTHGTTELLKDSFRQLDHVGAMAGDGQYGSHMVRALLDATILVVRAMVACLEPRRLLRDRLMGQLQLPVQQAKPKTRGRGEDPEIEKRDKRLLEAWETGHYKTYAELGRVFDIKPEAVRKALIRAKRRRES